jgi:hypothetical protein
MFRASLCPSSGDQDSVLLHMVFCTLTGWIFPLNMFRVSSCPSSGEQDRVLLHMVFCTGCAGCGCVQLGRKLCAHSAHRSNKTPTWSNTVQVLFLQKHSTCFGRQAPIIIVPNMVMWWPTCNYNTCTRGRRASFLILLMMGAWRPKHVSPKYGDVMTYLQL